MISLYRSHTKHLLFGSFVSVKRLIVQLLEFCLVNIYPHTYKLHILNSEKVFFSRFYSYRWLTSGQAVGFWLLDHVIYLKLRRKYVTVAKAEQIEKRQLFSFKMTAFDHCYLVVGVTSSWT